MANISYSINPDGTEVGRWLGKSYREGGQVKKKGQIYLGKVISKEKNIFYKRGEGYFIFDPLDPDHKIHPVPQEDLPVVKLLDRRRRNRNVIVSFGGCYFLDRLIIGIQYYSVLNVIETGNKDSFYALLQYYVLSDKADMHARYGIKMCTLAFCIREQIWPAKGFQICMLLSGKRTIEGNSS